MYKSLKNVKDTIIKLKHYCKSVHFVDSYNIDLLSILV